MEIALDEWRPGFARRYNDFADVVEVAKGWTWNGETVDQAKSLVISATPDLTDGERCTLLQLLECLNVPMLKESEPYVWPSSRFLAMQHDKSESVIRSRRAALERKGYLIRDYNRANRPAGDEAISLAPVFARFEELKATRDEVRARNAAYRDQQHIKVVDLSSMRAQAPNTRHLEQSQSTIKRNVTESAAPTARTSSNERASPDRGRRAFAKEPSGRKSGPDSAIGSPRRARGLSPAKSDPSSLARMVREELQMALQVCPALSTVLGSDELSRPEMASFKLQHDLERLANELLPEEHRNNELTVRWGWQRHGIRAAAMLAIALTDPRVANPCRYFGKLATSPPTGELDLRLNLARILKWQALTSDQAGTPNEAPAEEAPRPSPAAPKTAPLPTSWPPPPGGDHPTWAAIAAVLRRRIGKGRYDTWFAPNVGFNALEAGILSISAPPTAADQIKWEFRGAVIDAANEAGFEVTSLVIVCRRMVPH